MPITLEILASSRIGSQLTGAIGADDPDDQNDFQVLILTSENGTGLTESDITLSSGTVVSLTGKGASWQATIRPPETAAVITMTVAADAFSEGNAETEKDIRVSTSFPDADAEDPSELFASTFTTVSGIAITPTRIVLALGSGSNFRLDLKQYTYAGVEQTSEASFISGSGNGSPRGAERIDFFNGDFLVSGIASGGAAAGRYRVDGGTITRIEAYPSDLRSTGITHSELGITSIGQTTFAQNCNPNTCLWHN